MRSNDIRRGDIFFVSEAQATGSEYRGGRPGIVVSNDTGNRFSPVLEVVYLTTKEKKGMPTHTKITATGTECTAICEQIVTVDKSRIRDYRGTCSPEEMAAVDACILVSLGISPETIAAIAPTETEEPPEIAVPVVFQKEESDSIKLIRAETERGVYKRLYENLLATVTAGR